MLKVIGIGNIRTYDTNFSNRKEDVNPSKLRYKYNLMSDTVSFKRSDFKNGDKQIYSCLANINLAEKISDESLVSLQDTNTKKFQNGETYVRLLGDVKNKSVFILNAGNEPINDNLMEFRQMIDAAKRGGAEKITAIIPYIPYSRQDRISEPGEALTAKMIADDIQNAGADKVVTFDLHSMQIQGFFNIPVTNISAVPLFADYFKKKGDTSSFVVVSPDLGGVKRAKKLAKELDVKDVIIYKERAAHNKIDNVQLFGDVKGKNCILIDDMIDTGGTITESAKLLKREGANDVYICATHGIFSGDAYANIENCPAKEVVVTDTIPLKKGAPENVKQLSVAELIAKEIND